MQKLHLLLAILGSFWFGSLCWSHEESGSSSVKAPVKKALPFGIYDLLAGDSVQKPYRGIATDPCWSNANITGVCLRADWEKVEPEKGVFDWSFFDQGISVASAHHKLVALTIYSGKQTPDWVYADGARRLVLTKVGRKGYQQVIMPAPWDATFLADWHALVAAFGARYDSNQTVSYVTATGPGRGGELYFVNSPEDLGMLNRSGGIRVWVDAAEKIGSFYASAFHSTPFIYPTGEPVPGPEGQNVLAEVVKYCEENWPDRFGIRSSGLRPGYPARGFVPQSEIRNKGFQMLKPFRSGWGRPIMNGNLASTIELGIRYGGRFIEVYSRDCDDPAEATPIAEANRRLRSLYGRDAQ
jgi:Beta-galactosidase